MKEVRASCATRTNLRHFKGRVVQFKSEAMVQLQILLQVGEGVSHLTLPTQRFLLAARKSLMRNSSSC
jgi:hypothetical protein